jgi:hypothetical protein
MKTKAEADPRAPKHLGLFLMPKNVLCNILKVLRNPMGVSKKITFNY